MMMVEYRFVLGIMYFLLLLSIVSSLPILGTILVHNKLRCLFELQSKHALLLKCQCDTITLFNTGVLGPRKMINSDLMVSWVWGDIIISSSQP